MLAALDRAGYRHVSWDVDPDDWEPEPHPGRPRPAGARRRLAREGDGARGAAAQLAGRDDRRAARDPDRRLREGGAELVGLDEVARLGRAPCWPWTAATRRSTWCCSAETGRVLGTWPRARRRSRPPTTTDRSPASTRRCARRPAAAPGSRPAPSPTSACFCLAGADLPVDDRRLLRSLRGLPLGRARVLRNDTFAVLRAGAARGWGVGVVCGTGLNCTGVAPDGRDRALRRPRRRSPATAAAATGWDRRRSGPPSAAATAAARAPRSSGPCPRSSACARRAR